ncbi:ribosome biogenesis GTP-binding protein YihA/YsxC [Egicoccus halophilus]|uniref:Probable GTP-binding protein EngB n=1 Tax=Egicoccus halophilus TaxID=1670830 RepID=A0A8J3ADF9_9ACTN|nr:ribosome biogenesis GTP-binding protein YihA/YsxC [Egicoccus halophilus]GGI04657.1 putative GTP-binding protein EngB [Egicoccus halophilus]
MSEPLPMRFVLSAPDLAGLPPSRAEVAVIGRSNVGKSSLLNALARRRDLAKTSGKPGKTRLLNLFETDGGTLVDLPGFGYAKVAATERRAWQQRMEHYLLEREPLVLTLLLVDGEVGPTALDRDMLGWLRHAEVPFQVVATKHDKVKASRRDRRKRDLASGCGLDQREVVWVSADKGVGIDRLRGLVRDALAGV